jgi:Na+-translocating ferredoxin:NAD+ oxidoreductase RnfA subunit
MNNISLLKLSMRSMPKFQVTKWIVRRREIRCMRILEFIFIVSICVRVHKSCHLLTPYLC